MFSSEEIGRLSALGLYQCSSLLAEAEIPGVALFEMDLDPSFPPFETILPEGLVIGKCAEAYMKHYLHCHPDFELIADNVQVVVEGGTLGEFDFFYRDLKLDKTVHLEMACKWYLLDPDAVQGEEWTGPNRRDFLSQKLKKLYEQQFALLNDPRSLPRLKEIGIDPRASEQRLALPGFAFVPSAYEGSDPSISPSAIAGTWCRMEEFLAREDEGNQHYLCERKEWLIDPMYNRTWHARPSIVDELTKQLKQKYSPMVWTLHPDGSVERTFIVWW
ncbi:MAG: DUF1853 family protein [Flavobacteriales bacterium]|nr:DUF1853 family protein [Flavobacteriales bacterium]